jgi:hypothetical protein
MPILDDAKNTGRNTWNGKRRWPREFITLAVVIASVAIWGLGLILFGVV